MHESYDDFMKRLNAKREAIRNQNRIEEQKAISDRADRNAKQKESVQKHSADRSWIHGPLTDQELNF